VRVQIGIGQVHDGRREHVQLLELGSQDRVMPFECRPLREEQRIL